MDLTETGEKVATGFESIFCAKCGAGPDLREPPVIQYPRSAYGEVRYRYPCGGRPACLLSHDLTIRDLRALHKQIRASEFGTHLQNMEKVRNRLASEADEAAESKDRIAAARALHRLTREALEDAEIVDRKPVALPMAAMQEVRVIPGSIVDRKLKERVRMALVKQTRRAVEDAQKLEVPEPEDVAAPEGL